MKCISCGASFDDDELYFCTVCGAMMKNPITKEVVSENPGEENAPLQTALEPTASVVPDAPGSSEAHELPDNTPEEAFESSEKTDNTPPPAAENTPPVVEAPSVPKERDTAPPAGNDELYIAREREKERQSQQTGMYEEPVPFGNGDNDAQPQPEFVEKAPSRPKKVGAGRILGSSVIAIISGIVLVLVSLLFSLKLGLSPDRMSKSVEKMNVWDIINAEVDGMTVSDAVYYETNFDKATHGFADKDEFAFYLSKTDVTKFLAGKVNIYADYILNGKGEEPIVTENEITEFFMDYGGTAKDVFNYEMQTADYNSIRSSLTDHKTSERFSARGIGWAVKFRLENVKHILSYPTLTILAALFLVLFIWIAVVVNHKGRYTLGLYGNVLKWGGIVTVAAGLFASPAMALMYVLDAKFLYLCLSLLLFPPAVYAVIIGAILTVAGAILLKAKRAIKVKEKINKGIMRNS